MKYRSNFLTNVVLRIDFPHQPLVLGDKKPGFFVALEKAYPQSLSLEQAQVKFTVGPEQSGVERNVVGWAWHAKSDDGRKLIEFERDHLALTHSERSFTNFDDFSAEFRALMEAFSAEFAVHEFRRVGLRYINEFDLADGRFDDWNTMLSEDLTRPIFRNLVPESRMMRSIHQMVTKKEEFTVVTTYGLFNPDYPAPATRRHFVLDIDCYIEDEVPAARVVESVGRANSICEAVFESSIRNGLRERLGVVDGR